MEPASELRAPARGRTDTLSSTGDLGQDLGDRDVLPMAITFFVAGVYNSSQRLRWGVPLGF